MNSTDMDRLRKIQALYDSSTHPGEKAAALEALNRIRDSADRWLTEIQQVLKDHGFWKYIITAYGTHYVRIFRVETLYLQEHQHGGVWSYQLSDRGDGNIYKVSGTDAKSLEKELNKRKPKP